MFGATETRPNLSIYISLQFGFNIITAMSAQGFVMLCTAFGYLALTWMCSFSSSILHVGSCLVSATMWMMLLIPGITEGKNMPCLPPNNILQWLIVTFEYNCVKHSYIFLPNH